MVQQAASSRSCRSCNPSGKIYCLVLFRLISCRECPQITSTKVRDHEELWFRGVSMRTYSLIPSLFRCFVDKAPSIKQLRDLESDLFFEFLAKARFTQGAGLTEWDVLFLMQHYRAPTRLLDWTEVLHVAVYFAVAYRATEEHEPARIYVMNPYLWNKKHGYGRDLYAPRYFGWDEKVIIMTTARSLSTGHTLIGNIRVHCIQLSETFDYLPSGVISRSMVVT